MNKNSFTILNIQFVFCYFKEKGRAGPPHIEKTHAQSGVQASRPQKAWDKMQRYPRTEIRTHAWSGEAGTQVSMVLLARPIHPCVYPQRDHRQFKSRVSGASGLGSNLGSDTHQLCDMHALLGTSVSSYGKWE